MKAIWYKLKAAGLVTCEELLPIGQRPAEKNEAAFGGRLILPLPAPFELTDNGGAERVHHQHGLASLSAAQLSRGLFVAIGDFNEKCAAKIDRN